MLAAILNRRPYGDNKFHFFRVFLAAFLFLWGVFKPSVGCSKELWVGVEKIDYYPYYHLVEGEYQGFARDVLDAFAREYGHVVKYRPLPIQRLYQELFSKKIDFKFPDNPLWKKELKSTHFMQYSQPVVGFIDGVLVLDKRQKNIEDDFHKVGFVRGFTPWTLMDRIEDGQWRAKEVNSLESLLMLVSHGRIDGAYFNIKVAETLIERKALFKSTPMIYAPSLPHDKNNYVMSTANAENHQVLEQFNAFLASATMKTLLKQYHLVVY